MHLAETTSILENKLKNYSSLAKALVVKPIKNPRQMFALGAAFLSGISATDAAIVYSGVRNNNCPLLANSNRCYVDIDGNGLNDFEIHRNHAAGNVFIQVDEVAGGGFDINGFHAQGAAGYAYPYANAAGVVIGPAAIFAFGNGQGNTLSELNNGYPNDKWTALPTGTTRFIGVRGLVAGATRYGWIRLTKNAFGNFTVVDWAYEDSGAPITTGITSTLPIQLLSFSGKELNRTAFLNWATNSEVNNAGFDVERSNDGLTYKSVGWITGNGHSAIKQEYHFEDKLLKSGKTFYYRLRQVDFDGKFKYSNVITIKTAANGTIAGQFYPNPSIDKKVAIDFSAPENGNILVEVFTADGKKCHTQNMAVIKGNSTLFFNFSNLASGNYYVKFETKSGRVYRTMVVM